MRLSHLATRYLAKSYLRYFLLILAALVLFFVALEYLQSLKSLPDSANLQVLYLWYKALYALDVVMPVTIVFAAIALVLYLVRSNEMVAFYSVGISKKRLAGPVFGVAAGVTLLYLLLHTTSFTYADEYAKNIKKYQTISSSTKDLFFKYNDAYVFFKQLLPLQKVAKDVRIFETSGHTLQRVVLAKRARFEKNAWRVEGAVVLEPHERGIKKSRQDLVVLEGFRPRILDSVYEGRTNISLPDVLYALRLFVKQGLSTQKLRAILYAHLFFPLFAPLLVVLIFAYAPASPRLANLGLFTFASVLGALLVWGTLYLLVKLAFAQTIQPELAIILPVTILAFAALWAYKRF